MIAHAEGKPVQYAYPTSPDKWFDFTETGGAPQWGLNNYFYRAKPEPVTRLWAKPDDVPLNCWMRVSCNPASHFFVTEVRGDSVIIGSSQAARREWDNMQDLEHSTDRKTWQPCTITEEAK